jgi:hypothetical protein
MHQRSGPRETNDIPGNSFLHSAAPMGRTRRRAMITVIALVIGSRPALAALWFNDDRKALPCRPTIACTADIVPPGSFELEALSALNGNQPCSPSKAWRPGYVRKK